MSQKGYDTNLASEFYVMFVLHRLGCNATITLGNKKAIDIVVTRGAGEAVTIDVKAVAGKTDIKKTGYQTLLNSILRDYIQKAAQ